MWSQAWKKNRVGVVKQIELWKDLKIGFRGTLSWISKPRMESTPGIIEGRDSVTLLKD